MEGKKTTETMRWEIGIVLINYRQQNSLHINYRTNLFLKICMPLIKIFSQIKINNWNKLYKNIIDTYKITLYYIKLF